MTQAQKTINAIGCLKSLGYDLQTIRNALPALTGLSYTRVAEVLGVSRQAITNTMTGARTNIQTQGRIAEAYGVPADEIFEPKQCCCARCRQAA